MNKILLKKRGFTIVELLVTIAIIGIMTAILIPAMLNYDKRNRLGSTTEQVKSLIQQANNMAVAPRAGDSGVQEYAVKFTDVTASPIEVELGYRSQASPDDWNVISRMILNKVVTVDLAKVCPKKASDKFMEIGFRVPNGEPVFNRVFNNEGRGTSAGSGCVVTDEAAGLWSTKADDAYGRMELCISDGQCKTVMVHSYSGQIVVK